MGQLCVNDVLVVLRPSGEVDEAVRSVRARLLRLYGDLLPEAHVFARPDASGTHVVAGLVTEPAAGEPGELHWWGLPVGGAGEATGAEVASAVRDLGTARALLGSWVLLHEQPHGLRLVTSSDLVHTLVRAEGPDGVAWSTRGLAALRAAGAPVRIATERVPELIAYDYVLGDDELLAGTTVLHEATVVDSRPEGHATWSYWTREERFAPGPPTDARGLRELLTADLVRLAAVPGAHVALTAGRDSTLIASCLLEQGLVLPSFTIGYDGFPDVVGARATAALWGSRHVLLGAPPGDGPSFRRAIAKSAWTEGLDTAWNLVGPGLSWTGERPMVWLAGSGGEIGRAFYGFDRPGGAPAHEEVVASLMSESEPARWRRTRRTLHRRTASAVDAAALGDHGRTGWDELDLLYAVGRMRKWLMRTMPRPEARGMLAAYTSPALVRALLDIPAEQRAARELFDKAIALGPLELYPRDEEKPAPTEQRSRGLRNALPAPVRRAIGSRLPVQVPGDLGVVLGQLPSDLVCREVMGGVWWRETVRAAQHDRRSQHLMWNAVAVEALAQWLREADLS